VLHFFFGRATRQPANLFKGSAGSRGLVLSSFLKQRVCCKFPFATQVLFKNICNEVSVANIFFAAEVTIAVLLHIFFQHTSCCIYFFTSPIFCNIGVVAEGTFATRMLAFYQDVLDNYHSDDAEDEYPTDDEVGYMKRILRNPFRRN